MKTIFALGGLALLFLSGCNIKIEPTSNANITVSQNGNSVDIKVQQSNSNTTVSNNPTSENKSEKSPANKPKEVVKDSSDDMKTVKIYVVKESDVGCGSETLTAVNREILDEVGVLKATIEELLAFKDDKYVNSVNDEYKLEKVSIENGTARIYFTGPEPAHCAAPRFSGQVEKTATQFPTVKRVEVYINGKTDWGGEG